MTARRFALQLLVIAGLAALGGCGSKGAAKSSVTGRVYYRGDPLNGGAIVFVPDAERGNNGPLAKGAIQKDGTFFLNADSAAGVATGWYRVSIAPSVSQESPVPIPSAPYPGPPTRYRNPQLSGLIGEVKPGAENVFEFNLDD
jgi:hypothetical protein